MLVSWRPSGYCGCIAIKNDISETPIVYLRAPIRISLQF